MRRVLMTGMFGVLALVAGMSPAGALQTTTWGADPISVPDLPTLPDASDADACTTFKGARSVCLFLDRDEGNHATAKACVYDDAGAIVLWWYVAAGQVACAETHHWSYLGGPGVCFGTSKTGQPTGCVGQDRVIDDREPDHCAIWVWGASFCLE